MPRPIKCRRVDAGPNATFFKPAGIPVKELETVNLTLDELEALRLADLEGLYQEEAAARMGVSRQTFGNIVALARNKTARALCGGMALSIGGGVIHSMPRRFLCPACGHGWDVETGRERPETCPVCHSPGIVRDDNDPAGRHNGRGCGHRHGRGGHTARDL